MIPPAWDTATGDPSNPKSTKAKNIRPVMASKAAFATTRMKLARPTRSSGEPGGCVAMISKAETAIRPWAMPESPQSPLAATGLVQAASRLPPAAASTYVNRRTILASSRL